MHKYTNNKGISLPMAVWLANDSYAHDSRPNVISVSSMLKSTRQLVLRSRLKPGDSTEDLSMLIASRMGTAIHEAIEKAWVENYRESLAAIGYPAKIIDRLRINPETVEKGDIPIYLEGRTEREVGGWIVSGQYDMICDGFITDVKSTGVSTYLKKYKDEDYILQCSLYRWLNQDKVTREQLKIQYLFKDWSLIESFRNKDYPPLPLLEYTLPLMSIHDTERFVQDKFTELAKYWSVPEAELPKCTNKELWIRDAKWKHYATISSKRASPGGTFDTKHEAQAFMLNKGKGIIKEVTGTPMACLYCDVKNKCSQYAGFIQHGVIKIGQ